MLGVVIYNILDKEPHGYHIKALFVTFKIPSQLAAGGIIRWAGKHSFFNVDTKSINIFKS